MGVEGGGGGGRSRHLSSLSSCPAGIEVRASIPLEMLLQILLQRTCHLAS